MVVVQGIIMADSVRGREKKVREACVIPGILLAGVLLTSINVFPKDGVLGFLPCDTARFFVILFCFYGGISILKDLTLYFMKVKGE